MLINVALVDLLGIVMMSGGNTVNWWTKKDDLAVILTPMAKLCVNSYVVLNLTVVHSCLLQ